MPVLKKTADVNADGEIVETLSFQVGNGKKKKTDKFNPQLQKCFDTKFKNLKKIQNGVDSLIEENQQCISFLQSMKDSNRLTTGQTVSPKTDSVSGLANAK